MAEKAVLQIAQTLEKTQDISSCQSIPGTVFWSSQRPENGIELPSFEEILQDKSKYAQATALLHFSTDPYRSVLIYQRQDNRYVVQNPPQLPLEQEELDKLYLLDFERKTHPYYARMGAVPALEMIQFSITAVRGCYGMCSFCALTHHQTTHVLSRSIDSIVEETKMLTRHPDFRGTISDVGGPTANMYNSKCQRRETQGQCKKFCLHPAVCENAKVTHEDYLELLEKIKSVAGVKHLFVSSGIRHDLILMDKDADKIIKELIDFTPGQLKLAPEHAHPKVLKLMRKPPVELFLEFKRRFESLSKTLSKKRYVIGYFIVAHPGESMHENDYLKKFIQRNLGYHPQQIQIFTPSPGTLSTAMYYTGIDPITGEEVFVERSLKHRNKMKQNVNTNG